MARSITRTNVSTSCAPGIISRSASKNAGTPVISSSARLRLFGAHFIDEVVGGEQGRDGSTVAPGFIDEVDERARIGEIAAFGEVGEEEPFDDRVLTLRLCGRPREHAVCVQRVGALREIEAVVDALPRRRDRSAVASWCRTRPGRTCARSRDAVTAARAGAFGSNSNARQCTSTSRFGNCSRAVANRRCPR